MSKDAAAWLIVRTIGVLVLLASAYHLFVFCLNILFVLSSYLDHESTNGTLRLVNLNWNRLFYVAGFAAVARYFLVSGSLCHKLLMKEGSERGYS